MDLKVISSKLSLVDLAGSERMELSSNHRMREESININKSLFNLKKVMIHLAEGEAGSHVPFRDSKLTCLLQQSLGGTSSCLMVCDFNQIGCINLSDAQFEESVSTLIFSYKATAITNTPTKQEEAASEMITQLQKRIKELESELSKANYQISSLSNLIERMSEAQHEEESPPQEPETDIKISHLVDRIDNIENHGNRLGSASSNSHISNTKMQFLNSLSMIKELLVSNQNLREELGKNSENMNRLKYEFSSVIAENQEMREQLYMKQKEIEELRMGSGIMVGNHIQNIQNQFIISPRGRSKKRLPNMPEVDKNFSPIKRYGSKTIRKDDESKLKKEGIKRAQTLKDDSAHHRNHHSVEGRISRQEQTRGKVNRSIDIPRYLTQTDVDTSDSSRNYRGDRYKQWTQEGSAGLNESKIIKTNQKTRYKLV